MFHNFSLTTEILFSSKQPLTCLYTFKASLSTDQLTSDIMNNNERDVIIKCCNLFGIPQTKHTKHRASTGHLVMVCSCLLDTQQILV